MTLDNENPTILDASQLNSYRQRRNAKQETKYITESVVDILMGNPQYTTDPFYMSEITYPETESESDGSGFDPIDIQEIYDLIAPISDPEHPLSLESLGVVKFQDIHLSQLLDHSSPVTLSRVLVELTPTVTHCSLATVIGLGVRVRLEQALPPSYRVEVKIKKNTHNQADEVNKQLADKERVAAALENQNLMGILKKMMQPCFEEIET
ncbi:hypothetical protein K3495_g5555 [Podosphaera aphanis]|nr:hypothetical protein K3495_g5555 [Podosphaera aphanis]